MWLTCRSRAARVPLVSAQMPLSRAALNAHIRGGGIGAMLRAGRLVVSIVMAASLERPGIAERDVTHPKSAKHLLATHPEPLHLTRHATQLFKSCPRVASGEEPKFGHLLHFVGTFANFDQHWSMLGIYGADFGQPSGRLRADIGRTRPIEFGPSLSSRRTFSTAVGPLAQVIALVRES